MHPSPADRRRSFPDLTEAKAQWVRRGLVAWDVPDPGTRGYRLHWSRDGDLAIYAGAVTVGSSVPLTYDPSGLPADVLADFPRLVDYAAFRLRRSDLRNVPDILTGQLAVASYCPTGSLHDASGVQIPGVLDDLYAAAARRSLGVTWRAGKPTLRVWAPTGQDDDLRVWHGSRLPQSRWHERATAPGPSRVHVPGGMPSTCTTSRCGHLLRAPSYAIGSRTRTRWD
jgi:hypothetical protein